MRYKSWIVPVLALGILGVFLILRRMEKAIPEPSLPTRVVPVEVPPTPPQPVPSLSPQAVSQQPKMPAVPGNSGAVEECRQQVSFQSLMTLPAIKGSDWSKILDSAQIAYLCEAVAGSNQAGCNPLRGWNKGSKFSMEDNCRSDFEEFNEIVGAFKPQDLSQRACVNGLSKADTFREDAFAQVCEIAATINRGEGSESSCSHLAGFLLPKVPVAKFKKNCEFHIRSLQNPSLCVELKSPIDRATCEQRARLTGALRSNAPALCGDSAFCKAVLAGQPSLCQPYRLKAVSMYCEAKDQEEKASARSLMDQEIAYRKFNNFPPYRPGDPFIHTLTPPERARYEDPTKGIGQRSSKKDITKPKSP